METNKDGVKKRQDIDHGWAWVVMAASYMGMVLYCITLYMTGVLYVALLGKYGESETKTSLAGALSTGMLCFIAPVAGVINNRFSCRVSIVLGGFFTSVGFASSAFVPDLNWMIFTLGVLVGAGLGISQCGLICVVGFYFEKKRDQIVSLAFLCVGIVMFLSAPFGMYLIENFGLSYSLLILGCIQAQMCVLGMLCKPSVIENEIHTIKQKSRKEKSESWVKSYIDFSLLLRKGYLFYLISTFSWNFALCVAIMHLPNYVTVLGGTSSDISWLMTSFSISNLFGRLLGSLIIGRFHDKSPIVHIICLAVSGAITSLFPLYSNIPGAIYMFAIQLGVFTGWPNSMMTPLSLSFVGVEKLSEAYGLAYVFCGIGMSTGPVVIGYVFDISGSYETSFVIAGVVLIIGCISATCGLCCRGHIPEKELAIVVSDDVMHSQTSFTNNIVQYKPILEEKGRLVDNQKAYVTNNVKLDLRSVSDKYPNNSRTNIYVEQKLALLEENAL